MIPLSPLLGTGTFIANSIFRIWAKKQEQKHDAHVRSMSTYNAEEDGREKARKADNKRVSFTRRTVFIMLTAAIIAPIFAPIFGVSSAVMYTEVEPGFLWIEDREVTKVVRFGMDNAVMVVPPLLFDAYFMIMGYYVGGKVGK